MPRPAPILQLGCGALLLITLAALVLWWFLFLLLRLVYSGVLS